MSRKVCGEPGRAKAKAQLSQVRGWDPNTAYVSTLAAEKQVNSFFRLHSPGIIAKLRETFPDPPDELDPKTVFLTLRELRHSW